MSKLKDIPNEVLLVWAIKMQGSCGSSIYEKCREIVAKYPEHFPDEAKYKKVPQSVHDAYYADTSYNHQSVLSLLELPTQTGKEIQAEIEKGAMNPTKGEFTIKDFEDAMEMMAKHDRDERMAEKKRADIWNKHYAKYGLYYVKGKHIIT